jgi:hypothetical protein
MKSKMKRQVTTELPRFVVGALATAGASAANGATVQIAFLNNYVANTANGGLTNFNGDLTGDTFSDVVGEAFGSGAQLGPAYPNSLAYAFVGGDPRYIVNVGGVSDNGATVQLVREVRAFSFTDANINGGFVTNGWLDLSATSGPGGQEVRIHRLIFDDESTTAPSGVAVGNTYNTWQVPEPSSFALLALGAGGLTLRRRRLKRAA